jgi:hypothetical protein
MPRRQPKRLTGSANRAEAATTMICSSRRSCAAVAARTASGLAALAELDPTLPRYTASAAYLHERAGDATTATKLYVEAAAQAQNLAERNHLTLKAATLRQRISGEGG